MMKKTFVFFAALVLVLGFTLSASAEWNLYGNARIATFYTDTDLGKAVGGASNTNAAGNSSVDDLQWDLQGNSRFGANITAGDSIKAQAEFGVTDSLDGGAVTTRRIYGIWDFGPGELKIGHDYTPITDFLSGQVFNGDAGLLQVGNPYGSRRAQLALKFGGFEVAFIRNQEGAIVNAPAASVVEDMLPKIELAYRMKTDAFMLSVFGGYQTYDLLRPAGLSDISVDSYMFGANFGMDIAAFFFKVSASYYVNGNNAGWVTGQGAGYLDNAGNDVNDNESLMACLVAGFKLNENNTLEAGVGYLESELDQAPTATYKDNDYMEYYVQWVAQIAPGVFVIPEIGLQDYGDAFSGADEGDLFYLGAKWQINF
jgi:hypothetical protein